MIILYSILSLTLEDEYFDEALRGHCLGNGWEMQDSGVTMLLTNVLICAPIW